MPEVRKFLPSVTDPARRALVTEIIDQFCSTVLPVVGQLDQVSDKVTNIRPCHHFSPTTITLMCQQELSHYISSLGRVTRSESKVIGHQVRVSRPK